MPNDPALDTWKPNAPLSADEVQALAALLWRAMRAATFAHLREMPEARAAAIDRAIRLGAPVSVSVRELAGNRLHVVTRLHERNSDDDGAITWETEFFVRSVAAIN